MGKIAGIDYGRKRIGLALSDASKTLALPLTTVDGGNGGIARIAKALASRLGEIECIVIGLPLLLNGQKGEMAEEVERFAKKLEEALHLPIFLFDERLSSRAAEAHLKEIPLNRKKRNAKIDEVAATLLLQSYLDRQHAHAIPPPPS